MNKTDKILSSIAHEYRTPLGLISMQAEFVSAMCQNNSMDTKDIMKRMDAIRTQCKRLEYITTLALSANPEKDSKLSCHTGNINEFFSALTENANLCYKDNNVKITFKYTLSSSEYCCDYGLLEQIALNLVTNAIKYNNKKTKRITITARENKVSTIFEFKDNGIGIDEKNYSRIFDKHYRGKSNIHDGLGLGLHIVKSFVELMCGKVTVKSIPGHGSTFTITLPKNIPPDPGFREISKSYFSKTTMDIYRTAFDR